MTITLPEFSAGIRICLRARFLAMAIGAATFLGASVTIGAEFSARQPATVALDTGLSTLRLILPLIAVFLLQELVSREFDRRLYLTSLTYPRPRHQFLLGRVATIAILLFGLLVILAALLLGLTVWIAQGYAQATPPDLGIPYIVTIAFLAVDLLIVLAIGTLIAVTTSTPSFVLIGTIGFTLVARSYSSIIALLTRNVMLVDDADRYQSSLSQLGYILPDLASLDVRMIALYGKWQFLPGDWLLHVVSALIYAAALFSLSVWALNRKKFA